MPLLPRRFERLRSVLKGRMANLTVLMEAVEKPHNLSAILRTCDATGVFEAHAVSLKGRPRTFNSTAQGSQKWVPIRDHDSVKEAFAALRAKGFRIYGTMLGVNAIDYRSCDFTKPAAFVLGAEKWGLTAEAGDAVDQPVFIPMSGMVQSLNVSVAAATLLFEAVRQRQAAGLIPTDGEGLTPELFQQTLFEWAYPQVACWCRDTGRPYPGLSAEGEFLEELPRTVKLRC